MAFSTIQGSGGAPDSFVGTSGVDTISIINSTGNFFLGAQEADDVVTLLTAGVTDPGVITGATLKGGQGNDSFIDNNLNVLNGVFLNGNSNADVITFNNALLSGSTVQGGQGADNITLVAGSAGAVSSLINGNRDNDTLTVNAAVASSSLFGGQGNDTIAQGAAVTASVVGGDDGNDQITTGANSVAGSTLNGGAGNDTVNAGAATSNVVANGEDGNDVVTSNAGTDTLDGGAGNDTITGGTGADRLTGGTGINQFVQAAGDSVAASAVTNSASATIFTAGTVFTATFANGVDVITDFNSTSTINAAVAGIVATNLLTNAGVANAALTAAGNVAVQGNYNASTGVFTASNTGADILFGVLTVGGDLANLATSSTILVGGANGFTAANIV